MSTDSLIGQDQLDVIKHVAEKTPPGIFVEVGVYRGGSAKVLSEITTRQNRELHLYDTFTGIPEKSDIDRHEIGDFNGPDLQEIKFAIPNATFHVGFFPDTLTDDIKDIAFVHADADQYETTKAIIEKLWPRMIAGGIMFFDDYPLLAGVKKAIDESIISYCEPAMMNFIYAIKV